MELVHGKRKESKFAPQDFISNMPDNVVTNILDRLPIQDAVGTSILARSWRFKWTMLSQLVFDEYFISQYETNQVRIIISRLLLHIKGAITKFSFSVQEGPDVEDEDISHWILFLSSKGIKGLTIRDLYGIQIKLPTHFFSCLELKHLELANCCFNPPPTFHGFPNLLSFELSLGGKYGELGAFITQCPLLESLKLNEVFSECKLKLADIAKLKNLRILTLSLCDIDTNETTSSGTIFEILSSLPKLQELELCFEFCYLVEDGANQRFQYRKATASELCLIKYLLASSPYLKKIVIHPHLISISADEKLWFTRKLLKLHRVSPDVDIDAY